MFQPREYTESEGEEEAWSFQELQVWWKATPGPCRFCTVSHQHNRGKSLGEKAETSDVH